MNTLSRTQTLLSATDAKRQNPIAQFETHKLRAAENTHIGFPKFLVDRNLYDKMCTCWSDFNFFRNEFSISVVTKKFDSISFYFWL